MAQQSIKKLVSDREHGSNKTKFNIKSAQNNNPETRQTFPV